MRPEPDGILSPMPKSVRDHPDSPPRTRSWKLTTIVTVDLETGEITTGETAKTEIPSKDAVFRLGQKIFGTTKT
jgi:hypothetical protein